ncbi:MAG: GAF domain-containing protein, partial [Hymenobacter sp.]
MMLTTASVLLPADEAARLFTLHHYDILHSLQESVFNEFVVLAGRIFNLPMSLLGLVDASEVEYKARYGLPGLQRQARPEAICSQVVAQGEMLIFSDLARTSAQQLPLQASQSALGKGLRFYAGAPLRMANQAVIGTLCVLGQRPRSTSDLERRLLERLAHLIERVIEVRHACLTSRGLGQEYWRLTQEYIANALREVGALHGAAGIRRAALPPRAGRWQ